MLVIQAGVTASLPLPAAREVASGLQARGLPPIFMRERAARSDPPYEEDRGPAERRAERLHDAALGPRLATLAARRLEPLDAQAAGSPAQVERERPTVRLVDEVLATRDGQAVAGRGEGALRAREPELHALRVAARVAQAPANRLPLRVGVHRVHENRVVPAGQRLPRKVNVAAEPAVVIGVGEADLAGVRLGRVGEEAGAAGGRYPVGGAAEERGVVAARVLEGHAHGVPYPASGLEPMHEPDHAELPRRRVAA